MNETKKCLLSCPFCIVTLSMNIKCVTVNYARYKIDMNFNKGMFVQTLKPVSLY